MVSLSTLPEAIWAPIISYLEPHDLQNLLLVDRSIKEKVERYLYHELTLTEWASSGARLALAIDRGIVSNETCECVEVLRIQFTSIEEISETLRLSLKIQPRMPNIHAIYIEAHTTEDALMVAASLVQTYRECDAIGVVARSAAERPLAVGYSIFPVITSLQIPRLFRQEIPLLKSMSELILNEVYEDGSSEVLTHPLQRLSIPYTSYIALGSPSSGILELRLDERNEEVVINDAGCTVLKLVTERDLPNVNTRMYTPSLRALILCNIAPLPTIKLLENNNLSSLEFLSLAPVTVPALQALANKPHLPSLHVLLVLISRTSFLTDTPFLRKRETRRLVEWLQMLAAQYPVDVRDMSGFLSQDIYFSDGLWCLAAQTRYRTYLPLVAPPPLNSH